MPVWPLAQVLLGVLPAGLAPLGDVVTLKNGQELECLVVEIDEHRVKLLRGTEGISESRQLLLSEVSAIRLAPPDVSGFRTVAQRLEADRSLEEAGEVLRQVCILKPEMVADRLKLAGLYRRAGRFEEAMAVAQAAQRAAPEDPRVMLELAEISLAQGDGPGATARARAHLKRVGSDSAEGWWLLGRTLEKSGLPEEALAAYRDLLRLDPRRGDGLERFLAVALGLGKFDAAIEESLRVTRAAPDLRAGWIALGRTYYRMRRFEDAVAAFRSATSLGGEGYDRARIFFQCALARRFGRHPREVLGADDLRRASELDAELVGEQP